MRLTPEEHEALVAGAAIRARKVVDNSRAYTAIYYVIWTRGKDGQRVTLDEVGPYKHAKASSPYYNAEDAKDAQVACKLDTVDRVAAMEAYRLEFWKNR